MHGYDVDWPRVNQLPSGYFGYGFPHILYLSMEASGMSV